jgi:hypothetical protein
MKPLECEVDWDNPGSVSGYIDAVLKRSNETLDRRTRIFMRVIFAFLVVSQILFAVQCFQQ